ncbi:Major Facilitator Superfamily [Popillia japonica]|uniref:Major Facilitator Superfamily n=1 Tax=Popillia japonica TaxID=7064 RepID=A0AAW1N2J5_POPJA
MPVVRRPDCKERLKMTQTIKTYNRQVEKYETVPPEGGWGYMVTIAVSLTFIVAIVPTTVFGTVFSPFLSSLGDATGATTLINGVFNTALCFTGLPANHLLQKYSYRKVGLMGAVIYFIGTFGTIFVTSLFQMIISFGILQGIGFGFMMPSVFTAFHDYFEARRNVMMSVCQAIIAAVTIAWPALTTFWMDNFGFRGTAAFFSALSLNGILAMCLLQPAKWHYKKKKVIVLEIARFAPSIEILSAPAQETKSFEIEGEPLMDRKHLSEHPVLKLKAASIASLNGFAASLQNIHQAASSIIDEKQGIWQSLAKSLDLALFKDLQYVNIAFGLSLGMTSDLAFISIFPLLLVDYGFSQSDITLIMVVYFTADLVSRVLLCVISAIIPVWNRYVFLIGALFSAIFRIAFTVNSNFWWVLTVSGLLGFLRCFIQTPLPLVVAEQYGARFTTAFSLYMVVCGFVALTVGILTGWVKDFTHSNIMVVHLLTIVHLLCAIPWIIEICLMKMFKQTVT